MTALDAVREPLSGRPLVELGLLDVVRRRTRRVVTAHALSDDPHHVQELRRSLVEAEPPGSVVEVRTAGPERRQAAARALRATHRRPGGLGNGTQVYLVGSGKGGVGKSTLTANLAVAMAVEGRRVGVLDADVWGYSQPGLFGVRQPPVAVPGLMFPVPAHGVRIMSIGFFVEEEEPVVWRGPMLHKALEQFLADVYWGDDLDVLLVDLPPGTGDVPLSLAELLPEAGLVVVTTPQRAAESVAARVGRMAARGSLPLVGVVENMAGGAFGSGGGAELARTLSVPLLASVPLDPAVCRAGDAGVPVVLTGEGPAGLPLRTLAATLPAVRRRSLAGRSLPLLVAR